MRILPAVDVWGGQVVRLSRGDFSTASVYGEDPAAVARRWHDQGAELVHIVDLEGARHGVYSRRLWQSMAAAGVRFQAGGGMRTVAAVVQVIGAGARRAVLGSVAVWQPEELAHLIDEVGAGQVVVALDVREGRAFGSGWEDEGRPLEAVVDALGETEIERVLLTAIARDGMLSGPDFDLLGRVRALAPKLALIASGGISTLEDLAELKQLGVEEVVVGRALYEGRFSLEEALSV